MSSSYRQWRLDRSGAGVALVLSPSGTLHRQMRSRASALAREIERIGPVVLGVAGVARVFSPSEFEALPPSAEEFKARGKLLTPVWNCLPRGTRFVLARESAETPIFHDLDDYEHELVANGSLSVILEESDQVPARLASASPSRVTQALVELGPSLPVAWSREMLFDPCRMTLSTDSAFEEVWIRTFGPANTPPVVRMLHGDGFESRSPMYLQSEPEDPCWRAADARDAQLLRESLESGIIRCPLCCGPHPRGELVCEEVGGLLGEPIVPSTQVRPGSGLLGVRLGEERVETALFPQGVMPLGPGAAIVRTKGGAIFIEYTECRGWRQTRGEAGGRVLDCGEGVYALLA